MSEYDEPQDLSHLGGWDEHNPDRIAFAMSQDAFSDVASHLFQGVPPDTVLLYKAWKDVLGQYPAYPAQEIGDSFPAGTMITMADGSTKPIETVVPGDKILSRLGESAEVRSTRDYPYTGEMATLTLEDGSTITGTADHLAVGWCPGEDKDWLTWHRLAAITEGCEVATGRDDSGNRRWIKVIASSRFQANDLRVYCLETESRDYHANGVTVHNCTSFGTGHANDLLQCVQIAIGKKPFEFHETCTEAIYGIGRELANMLGGGDGCYGGAVAKAVSQVGAIDRKSVGTYSGSRAKSWGRSGVPADVKAKLAAHKVGSIALVSTPDDVVTALANGNPCIVCSNQGFTMTRDANGMCSAKGSWAHCLPPNSIVSGRTPRMIQDVVVGDEVYSHTGKSRKVVAVDKHHYQGSMYAIKAAGNLVSRTTSEHPYLVKTKRTGEVSWVKAEDVRIGDFLIVPKVDFDNSVTEVPIWTISNKTVNRPSPIDHRDADIAFLFGYYIADGNASRGHKVVLTIPENSPDESRLIRGFNKLGLEASVTREGRHDRVICYSSVLANAFIEWFGDSSFTKHIPDFIFTNGWDRKSLVEGYVAGDGCELGANRPNRHRITTISPILANQIWILTTSLGMRPIAYAIRSDRPGVFPNAMPSIAVEFGHAEGGHTKYDGEMYLLPVRGIDVEDYDEFVYNLEVEIDNSFIVNGVATHNCMMICGYRTRNGNKEFCIGQSWGPNTPSGPTADDQPDFSFWITSQTLASMLRGQDSWALSAFDGWPGQAIPAHWTIGGFA